ncbi:MAG: hypothetical protein B6I29_00385 [Marinitoga sp. 4572_148]|nr:MAG: hypothetical protein B6I29_00385 [Marinitoga sp. 4572_148]
MKLVFLVSGNGGNLKFINKCIKYNYIKNVELTVIADRECGALKYARNKNIESYKVKYVRNKNKELINLLLKLNPDIIITNIHKILDEEIVDLFYGKLINLHYSLLPAYPKMIGEAPIIKAIKETKFVGATVHYVDVEVDSGEIIIQGLTKNVGKKEEIINKIFRIGCLELLFTLINKYPEIKSSKLGNSSKERDLIFSPSLNYNYEIFSEDFWEEVKQTK